MFSLVRYHGILLAALLVIAIGAEERNGHYSHSRPYRKPREIRRSSHRDARVLHYDVEEPEKMVLLQNRPKEPLDDMYRKGFSYLHVPDFDRQAVESNERTPRRHLGNQTIDDIISGIIHLLGGDVHVTRPETRPPTVNFPSSPRPTRINDRGPAHFDVNKPPATLSTPVTHSDVEKGPTNQVVFPDDTDVSKILGLVNASTQAGVNADDTASHSAEPSLKLFNSTESSYSTLLVSPSSVQESTPMSESSVPTFYETTTRPYTNYTDLPILLPSRGTYSPETDWLPAAKPSERIGPFTIPTSDEPAIVTREPDHFEITVTQQMYTNATNPHTVTATPEDVTSSTDISVSIVSTQVDIIYGRPSASSIHHNPPPPLPSTGRPHVFAVDIEQVRPHILRPKPNIAPSIFSNTNGLRPLPSTARPPILRKPPAFRHKPPSAPEIRIDTCVVGDDSTCDVHMKEQCRTEQGVSACLCRLGYGRNREREPCKPVVSMLLTLKVAKLRDQNIDPSHFVPGSPEYQRLNYEASHAMSSIFSFSPLADAFLGSQINRIYFIAHRMVINSTVHLDESEVKGSLQHHVEHAVATAISRSDNRLGTSQLYVNGPLSALVEVEDLNECGDKSLNDCSEFAVCDNLFGTFQCHCKPGYTDKLKGDPRNAGRICSACSPNFCNGKGQCVVVHGRQECRCRGNYGGSRCQVDNEVVGVSVGVSVIAIIVIAVTAACLYLWNRRWKQTHQKQAAAKNTGYRLQTMADHVRWGPATPFGSTYGMMNGMMPDSTLQLPTSPYAIPHANPQVPPSEDGDGNPYGRIIRTLQKHNSMNLQYDMLQSECASTEDVGFPSVPSNSFVYHGSFPKRNMIYR